MTYQRRNRLPRQTLRDLCLKGDLIDPSKTPDHNFEYIDVSAVSGDQLAIIGTTHHTGESAPSRARKRVRDGDVLFATIRPTLKRVAVVPKSLDGNIASTAFCILRADPAKIDNRFLYYAVCSDGFADSIASLQRGVSYPAVTDSDVLAQEIPVPSMADQKAISAALSRVQRSVELEDERLRTLAEMKVAAIARVFSEGLRGAGSSDSEYGRVPSGWTTIRLRDCADIQTGITKGRSVPESEGVELPYLRVANVQDGYLDLSVVKSIQIRRSEIPRFSLRVGDVLLTEGGDFDKLGRGYIWKGEIEPCVHQNHVFAVRTDRLRLLPGYFAYLAQSPYGKRYFLTVAHKTTNLACINSTKLGEFPVLLPSIDEQRGIAELLSAIDQRIEASRQRRSTLHALFRAALNEMISGDVVVDAADVISADYA